MIDVTLFMSRVAFALEHIALCCVVYFIGLVLQDSVEPDKIERVRAPSTLKQPKGNKVKELVHLFSSNPPESRAVSNKPLEKASSLSLPMEKMVERVSISKPEVKTLEKETEKDKQSALQTTQVKVKILEPLVDFKPTQFSLKSQSEPTLTLEANHSPFKETPLIQVSLDNVMVSSPEMTPREVPSVLQLDLPPPTSPLLSEGEFASSLLEVIDSYSLSNDDDDSSSGKSDLDNRISLDTVRSSEVTLTESLDKLRPDIRRGSEDIKRDGRFKRESDDKLKRDSAISVHRKPVLRFDKSDSNLTEFPLHELVQVEPTHVYLEANRIASINLKHSVLSHLRVLDLSRNVLAELPQEIGNLTSLEDLSLDYNALVSLPQSFCQLKQLKSLSVAHNQIKSLDFNLFSQFGKLEYLDLSHNQLQSLPPSLGYCGTLKTLLIVPNAFSESFTATFVNDLAKTQKHFLTSKSMDSLRPLAHEGPEKYQRPVGRFDKSPGYCYLARILGHLCDEYDLRMTDHPRNSPTSWLLEKELESTFSYDYLPKHIPAVSVSEKANKILQEILQTEKTYVEELSVLHDLYLEPLSKGSIINQRQYSGLFQNVQAIIELHRDHFYKDLVACSRDPGISLGNLFMNLSYSLMCYQQYLNNYDLASALFTHFQQMNKGTVSRSHRFCYPNQQKPNNFIGGIAIEVSKMVSDMFCDFLQKASKHPRHTQINLGAYLILPVQRIPRYTMLLDSLVKALSTDHPDFQLLSTAADTMKATLEQLNEIKRQSEQSLKELSVLNKIRPVKNSFNMEYVHYSPFTRVFLKSYTRPDLRLVKFMRLQHSKVFDPTVVAKKSHCTTRYINGLIEYRFKYNPLDSAKDAREIETGGALARFNLARTQGKKVSMLLFNDCLLLTTYASDETDLICALTVGDGFYRSRCASVVPINTHSHEGVLRFTDGSCVIYLKGPQSVVEQWSHLLNTV